MVHYGFASVFAHGSTEAECCFGFGVGCEWVDEDWFFPAGLAEMSGFVA